MNKTYCIQISYAHIKVFLGMQALGISLEKSQVTDQNTGDKLTCSKTELDSADTRHVEVPHEVEASNINGKPDCQTNEGNERAEVVKIEDEGLCSNKRQKLDSPDNSSASLEASESSLLDWLKKFDEGVRNSVRLYHLFSYQLTKY